jgi:threonine/homoserine/homoserine lactone efflux protein
MGEFIVDIAVFSFLVMIPNGPIGFLILREMFAGNHNWAWIALGSAVSDIFYVLVILLGLSKIQNILLDHSGILQSVASLLLIGVGTVGLYRTYRSVHLQEAQTSQVENLGQLESVMVGFFGCVTNPTLLFSFSMVLTTLGVHAEAVPIKSLLIVVIITVLAVQLLAWYGIFALTRFGISTERISPRLLSLFSNGVLVLMGCIMFVSAMIHVSYTGLLPML